MAPQRVSCSPFPPSTRRRCFFSVPVAHVHCCFSILLCSPARVLVSRCSPTSSFSFFSLWVSLCGFVASSLSPVVRRGVALLVLDVSARHPLCCVCLTLRAPFISLSPLASAVARLRSCWLSISLSCAFSAVLACVHIVFLFFLFVVGGVLSPLLEKGLCLTQASITSVDSLSLRCVSRCPLALLLPPPPPLPSRPARI